MSSNQGGGGQSKPRKPKTDPGQKGAPGGKKATKPGPPRDAAAPQQGGQVKKTGGSGRSRGGQTSKTPRTARPVTSSQPGQSSLLGSAPPAKQHPFVPSSFASLPPQNVYPPSQLANPPQYGHIPPQPHPYPQYGHPNFPPPPNLQHRPPPIQQGNFGQYGNLPSQPSNPPLYGYPPSQPVYPAHLSYPPPQLASSAPPQHRQAPPLYAQQKQGQTSASHTPLLPNKPVHPGPTRGGRGQRGGNRGRGTERGGRGGRGQRKGGRQRAQAGAASLTRTDSWASLTSQATTDLASLSLDGSDVERDLSDTESMADETPQFSSGYIRRGLGYSFKSRRGQRRQPRGSQPNARSIHAHGEPPGRSQPSGDVPAVALDKHGNIISVPAVNPVGAGKGRGAMRAGGVGGGRQAQGSSGPGQVAQRGLGDVENVPFPKDAVGQDAAAASVDTAKYDSNAVKRERRRRQRERRQQKKLQQAQNPTTGDDKSGPVNVVVCSRDDEDDEEEEDESDEELVGDDIDQDEEPESNDDDETDEDSDGQISEVDSDDGGYYVQVNKTIYKKVIHKGSKPTGKSSHVKVTTIRHKTQFRPKLATSQSSPPPQKHKKTAPFNPAPESTSIPKKSSASSLSTASSAQDLTAKAGNAAREQGAVEREKKSKKAPKEKKQRDDIEMETPMPPKSAQQINPEKGKKSKKAAKEDKQSMEREEPGKTAPAEARGEPGSKATGRKPMKTPVEAGQQDEGAGDRESAEENKKLAQRANQIFLHMVRSFQGRVLSDEDMGKVVREFPDFLSVVDRFKTSKFRVFRHDERVRFVTVYHKMARVCLYYASSKEGQEQCRKPDCPYFHICRDFLLGSCPYEEGRCKFSHRLGDETNMQRRRQRGLESLGDEDMRVVLACSSPRLCQNAALGKTCPDFACPSLHFCLQHFRRQCTLGEACEKQHTWRGSRHNDWVLEVFHLTRATEQSIFKSVLVQREPAPTGARQPPSQRPPRPGPIPPDAEKTSVDIFRYLLRTCHGRVITPSQFAAAQAKFPDFLSIVSRYETSKFRVYKNNGETVCVTAYHKDARICIDYNSTGRGKKSGGCSKADCPYFHVCKDYVSGHCQLSSGACMFSHDLKASSCQELWVKLGLEVLEEEELRALLGCSRPRVCWAYSHGQGCLLPHCPDLHLCWNHFQKKCYEGSTCPRSHTWQDEGHNARILDLYRMKNWKEGLIFRSVLLGSETDCSAESMTTAEPPPTSFPPVQVEREVKPNNPVQPNPPPSPSFPLSAPPRVESAPGGHPKSDEVICENYVWGPCEGGERCRGGHGPRRLPYAWQVEREHTWVDMTKEWNDKLEQAFCAFHNSVEHVQLGSEPLQATVFLDKMMGRLESGGLGNAPVRIRRLSTPSFLARRPDNALHYYTRWVWKFMDDSGTMVKYEPASLQATLEDKFLAGQGCYLFKRDRFLYELDFHSMTQTNMETGKQRVVMRRPLYVTEHEVTFGCSLTSPLHEAVPPVSGLAVPPHWSPLDRWQDVELVKLEASSAEYQEVRSHFYRTLDPQQRPLSAVFRVQNPALWDQFESQRRAMENQLRLEGRGDPVRVERLFHGTDSLDVVRGICVQNFDHRLSGKNATVYGQGAYFARDASYSDGYTKGHPRYVFLARVLVGDFTVGTSDMKRPPIRIGHTLYDSCVNTMQDPAIFIVFKQTQCYPEYLIEYRDSSCSLPPRPPPPASPTVQVQCSSGGGLGYSAGGIVYPSAGPPSPQPSAQSPQPSAWTSGNPPPLTPLVYPHPPSSHPHPSSPTTPSSSMTSKPGGKEDKCLVM